MERLDNTWPDTSCCGGQWRWTPQVVIDPCTAKVIAIRGVLTSRVHQRTLQRFR